MTVSATSNSTGSSSAADVTKSGYDAFNDIGIEEFFKLMTTELQNQDPMDPMDNAEMLAQISQIRDIAASDNLTNTLETITSTFESVMLGQNMSTASSMIGQTVEAKDNNGSLFIGKVEQVTITDGIPTLRCTEQVAEQVDQETGETIPAHTAEHLVKLENISSIVPAGTTATMLSTQISAAGALVGRTIVAKEGELIVQTEDEEGNTTEGREKISTSMTGVVEKTLVENGEAKVQILIPAVEATEENQDPKAQHVVVSLSDVEQVLTSNLTEDLAVASSMVGRTVVGSVVGANGETGKIGGWVQQVYVKDGKAMLAVQPSADSQDLYALALDEVTNVSGYSDGPPSGSETESEPTETTTDNDTSTE